jgi:hypothetical protein
LMSLMRQYVHRVVLDIQGFSWEGLNAKTLNTGPRT